MGVMGSFKQGDTVLLDEQFVVTITSWPPDNVGHFGWSRVNRKDNAEVRGIGWYGENESGEPVHSAAKLELMSEGGPVVSTLPALPVEEVEPEAPAAAGSVVLSAVEYATLLAAAAKAAEPYEPDPEDPPVVEAKPIPLVKVASFIPTPSEMAAAKKAPAKKAPAKKAPAKKASG